MIKHRFYIILVFILFFICFVSGGFAQYIDDLEDVNINSVLNNMFLMYDSGTSNWTAQNFSYNISSDADPFFNESDAKGYTWELANTWNSSGGEWINNTNTIYHIGRVNIGTTKVGDLLNWKAGLHIWDTEKISMTINSSTRDAFVNINSGGTYDPGFNFFNKENREWIFYSDTSQSDNFKIHDTGTAIFTINKLYNRIGILDTTPSVTIEIEGSGKYSGTWVDDSDFRIKDIISGLPKNKVIKFCENVSIYQYYLREYWNDEDTGELYIGNLTDVRDIGIVAQELYNFTFFEFGEDIANMIVFKGNDSEIWGVNYPMVNMIFARGWQINNDRLKLLEDEIFG